MPAHSPVLATYPLAPTLLLIALAHSVNDLLQAVLPSLYPVLQQQYQLSYSQLGVMTLVFHLVACLWQPVVGWFTDRRPCPRLLPWAMLGLLAGMLCLGRASGFGDLLGVAALVGLGSSVFHPEASRAARAALPGRAGQAQSVFQLGGNVGSAAAPLLLAALLRVPMTEMSLYLATLALAGFGLLCGAVRAAAKTTAQPATRTVNNLGRLPRGRKVKALLLLTLLIFSKYVYLACVANFYTFFLIERFAVSIERAQLYLFVFLLAITLGTLVGGPLIDRIGRKRVIVLSILGACPFALLLPGATLWLAVTLSVLVGLFLASAFAAILLMAQDLLPGREGLVAGAFFGFTFGISGIAAAGLGAMADHWGVAATFTAASTLPLLGALAFGLPKDK